MSYIKYPRTFHLPWSLGATSDDKVLKNVDHFEGTCVVITEKMDGENSYDKSMNFSKHITEVAK